MKLWAKTNTQTTENSELIERFTTGDDVAYDLLLAPFDVQGSMAHVKMLAKTGLISPEEADQLLEALATVLQDIEAGHFQIEPGVEDVHSQVELLLTRRLGDVGKKVHAARSRNDQVLLDMKLWLRHHLRGTADQVYALAQTLLALSEKHHSVLLPGYTHLQVAMPSSFGLWFGAYAEALAEDLFALEAACRTANQNPLGSAAGYGSSLPIDRRYTTELLGFEDLNWNVVYAQMTRGKAEKMAAIALAQVASTLGRLCMDVVLYMSQNFGFLSLPPHLTTGSSIMPHKKNPDAFELMRARCNQLQSVPGAIQHVLGNLPSGYHRDLQVLKEHIMPAFRHMSDCLDLCNRLLPELLVQSGPTQEARYRYMFSVEAVNVLVKKGIPFREAYREVGLAIEAGDEQWLSAAFGEVPTRSEDLGHTHEGSLGNLCTAEIAAKLERAYRRIVE